MKKLRTWAWASFDKVDRAIGRSPWGSGYWIQKRFRHQNAQRARMMRSMPFPPGLPAGLVAIIRGESEQPAPQRPAKTLH